MLEGAGSRDSAGHESRTLTTAYIRDEGEIYREKEMWKERMMGRKDWRRE